MLSTLVLTKKLTILIETGWVFTVAEAYSTKEIDKLNEQRQRLANQSSAPQKRLADCCWIFFSEAERID